MKSEPSSSVALDSSSYSTRTLNDLIESVRAANGKCVILMGAGCSLSAGIPLASKFVADIKEKYPQSYARAKDKNIKDSTETAVPGYNDVMRELSVVQQRDLLNQYIEKATINWAHLALAQLLANNHVQRVLTVNFDPLLIKACGMVDFYPAIYDLAVTDHYNERRIAPNAVLYLNGQHTGFIMLNATDELAKHQEKLESIVKNTGTDALWLVVGYSGEADPLLEILASQKRFDNDLYWLGYEEQPSKHLIDSGLLTANKHAYYVSSQDADKSLATLAQQLECFPPDILVKPLAHVKNMVQKINFDTGGDPAKDIYIKLLERLEIAVNEEAANPSHTDAEKWLLAGELTKVIDWYKQLPNPSDKDKELASWAYIEIATEQFKKGHLDQAIKKYALALTIKTDNHEAAYNWGNALSAEATAVAGTGDLATALAKWAMAGEKYKLALAIKPDKHEAAFNWGVALDAEAKALAGTGDLAAAQAKWALAGEKYKLALDIKPDFHIAAHNWGSALEDEATALAGTGNLATAQAKWAMAGEKYKLALDIKPDIYEAAFNWGYALSAEAKALAGTGDLAAAQAKWTLAGEKYALALGIKPDIYEAAHNWGYALSAEAKALAGTGDLAAAQAKWTLAGEKYKLALDIKHYDHDTANNWGSALAQEFHATSTTKPEQATKHLEQAQTLLEKHSQMDTDGRDRVAYNLACVYALQGNAVKSLEQLEIDRLSKFAQTKEHIEQDKDFDNIRQTPEFKAWWKQHFGE